MYSAHSRIFFHESNVVTWQKAKPSGLLSPDKIEIWRIKLSSNKTRISGFYKLLAPEEKTRSTSFFHEADTHRFIIGKAMLRILLGNYLNTSPESLTFSTGMNNKPVLNFQSKSIIDFNISHSGDYILIAIADKPVGIDIEHYNIDSGSQEIMKVVFSKKEMSFITEQAHPDKTFYKLWTRKEALLKATAKGLNNDIPDIPCLNGNHFVSHMQLNSYENWRVNNFNIDEQHTGSIAYTGNKQVLFKLYNGLE